MSECKCRAKSEYNCICWQEEAASRREQQSINMLNDLRRELNKAIKERDEARECLLEAIKHADHSLREDDALSSDTEHYPYHKHYWPMVQRWMKAAGIYHIPDATKMVEDHIVDANKKEEEQ